MNISEMSRFEKIFYQSKVILTEGAFVERFKAEFHVKLDPNLNHAGFIYTNPEILEMLYKQYIDIGQKHQLPILVMTPTRKVNFDSLKKSAFHDRDLIHDSCAFVNKIKDSYGHYSPKIMLGGFLGCKGDAYSSKGSLDREESYHFHKIQTNQFAKENIDFLFAGIMPEINEAIGMARAIAETQLPYIISFMIRKDGCLIDGTSISDAIQMIDNMVDPKPICYMANCVHPANLRLALTNERNQNRSELARFQGIQANASALSPEELNNCTILHKGDYTEMVEKMLWLHNQFNLRIFGGCCGTNDQFLDHLAIEMIRT